MLNCKVAELLNEQINKEMYSAYLYLDFSNFYADKGLNGYSNWYSIQAKEEMDHALGILKYLQDNGHKVVLEAIAKPDKELNEIIDPLKFGLEHEHYITEQINTIYAAADEVKDYRTMKFLDKYISEQGEEEKNAADLVSQYELFGSDPRALYSINNELAQRTYTHTSMIDED